MKASAVGVEECHEVDGHDLSVDGVSVFEVILPNFTDNILEKLGHALLGHFVTGILIKSGFVGSLRTNANDCCGVVSNYLVVELETSQAYFVLDSLSKDGC
jgi:hypothetical protein